MKSLKRNDKGELFLTNEPAREGSNDDLSNEEIDASEPEAIESSIDHSPIVTETNFPVQAQPVKKPARQSIASALLSEEQLLAEMQKAGGHSLTTSQFAILIAPCIKKCDDSNAHRRWDLALTSVRFQMRKLEKQDKIRITKDTSSKRTRYLYSLA